MSQQDGDDLGVWSEFGTAAGMTVRDLAAGGEAPGEPHTGLGDRPDLDGLPPVGATSGFGSAPSSPDLAEAIRGAAPPKGYHNRVDADGDGHLDKATYLGDGHGGAEILVDLDGDGRADFVGHDTDLDNRVDFADYDKDHDGFFEKRMYDDNNDGLLDRAEWTHDS
ncbi:hypothetical protein [Paractinoplanes globisporus]|uniref:EF-hand domain-containing protein n=1 Tax=Paractinoplanes globisporus TaxID=113565 RepID=A0ABW6WKB0_9ACTN|nr:hypothetical protein [Actinoplanes globisporus]